MGLGFPHAGVCWKLWPLPFAFHFGVLLVALADSVPVHAAMIASPWEGTLAALALLAFASLAAFAGSLTQPGEELVLRVGLGLLWGVLFELDLSLWSLFLVLIEVELKGVCYPSFPKGLWPD